MVASGNLPSPPRVRVCNVDIDALTMDDAVRAIIALSERSGTHLVVTPNVDHVVMLEHDGEFRAAYERADLRLVDGAPIGVLARLLGTPFPARVTGVDLTNSLFEAAERLDLPVALFGGAPDVLERAVAAVGRDHPRLRVVSATAPRVDLDVPHASEREALTELRDAAPALLFVFLGAPKQEKWFLRRVTELPPCVVLAVGGTVDFLAGEKRRAPRAVQRFGCEWVWRMVQDPRRLFKRYVIRDSRFLVLAARALRDRYVKFAPSRELS